MSSDFVGQPHDFAFLAGRWNVSNRRLLQRHVGSDDWREFASTSQGWSHLDGLVSLDENRFPAEGFSGCTVRTLDRATKRWAIYWVNSTSGVLFPPVHGGFAGAHGEFFGVDIDDERPVQVKFVWTRGQNEARWEQAYSLEGSVWETNWTMALRRFE